MGDFAAAVIASTAGPATYRPVTAAATNAPAASGVTRPSAALRYSRSPPAMQRTYTLSLYPNVLTLTQVGNSAKNIAARHPMSGTSTATAASAAVLLTINGDHHPAPTSRSTAGNSGENA